MLVNKVDLALVNLLSENSWVILVIKTIKLDGKGTQWAGRKKLKPSCSTFFLGSARPYTKNLHGLGVELFAQARLGLTQIIWIANELSI